LPWKNEINYLGNQFAPVIVSAGKEGLIPNCKNDVHRKSGDSVTEVDSLPQTDMECLEQTSKTNDSQHEETTLRKSNRLKQLPLSKHQEFSY
jgi:hypothetical protein